MKNYGLMIFCLFSLLMGCSKQVIKPFKLTTFVNPFIGSDGPGNTYPGATTPFGMVQLSPDIGIAGWDRISGYYYQDSIISGFSHTHLSGTGNNNQQFDPNLECQYLGLVAPSQKEW